MGENNLIISAPIGAWEVKLEFITDRQTDKPTGRQTDMRVHGGVSLQMI